MIRYSLSNASLGTQHSLAAANVFGYKEQHIMKQTDSSLEIAGTQISVQTGVVSSNNCQPSDGGIRLNPYQLYLSFLSLDLDNDWFLVTF
jgi:hypothetical protein